MNTPICDFVKGYAESGTVRMHMPGHKGSCPDTVYDITEISGADSLYEANGIIKESEKNAGALFNAETFYSTEGSSLSIRAMLYLISQYAISNGHRPTVLAARNVHKSFISAAALIGFEIAWLPPSGESYLSSGIAPQDVAAALDRCDTKPTAVYLTSPDYLGYIADIKAISDICHNRGILLAVDNAHGAYLRFLPQSLHPINLGADICCDSAHKTLHALTGAAYLHISHSAPRFLTERAKDALALFGSTSPSYLILQSLDKLNAALSDGFSAKLSTFVVKIEDLKQKIVNLGYMLCGDEPMKITLSPKSFGYSGTHLAQLLSERGVECEFSDNDFLVLMPSPSQTDSDLERLLSALSSTPKLPPIPSSAPKISLPEAVMPPREALFSPSEFVDTEECVGRILADITVGCPPAVPIAVSGERIDGSVRDAFIYYGVKRIKVLR